MKLRCYTLWEDITDGRGLAYRHCKTCGLLGCILFLFKRGEYGKRIEWSVPLATEALIKKNKLKETEL